MIGGSVIEDYRGERDHCHQIFGLLCQIGFNSTPRQHQIVPIRVLTKQLLTKLSSYLKTRETESEMSWGWRAKTIFTFGNVVESLIFTCPCCCTIHKSYVNYISMIIHCATFRLFSEKVNKVKGVRWQFSVDDWNNYFFLLRLLLSHSQHHRPISLVN